MAVYLDFAEAIERYGKTEANKSGIHNPDQATILEERLAGKVLSTKGML